MRADRSGILALRAGVPPGVLNVVLASQKTTPELGETLCTHPAIRKVSFTGSSRVGKLIAKMASSTLKKLTLERTWAVQAPGLIA